MGPALLGLVLPDLERQAAKVAAGLAALLLLAVAFVISSLAALVGSVTPGGEIPTAHVDSIPPEQMAVIEAAADTCGLPWQVLAAVARVESNLGADMATSPAGAIGYGQFLPSTWAMYGGGGNPYDFHDALPAMARDLCANGGASDLRGALFAYNHADWYVNQVLAVAIRYGYVPPGSPASRVLSLSRAEIGVRYVWGGTSPGGFDCSGLVQWVYGQLGIALPRTAQQQYAATARVTPDQLRPGDLVFFHICCQPPDWVTHVAIYVGHGYMVDATRPGDIVREEPFYTDYWQQHLVGVGRVPGLQTDQVAQRGADERSELDLR